MSRRSAKSSVYYEPTKVRELDTDLDTEVDFKYKKTEEDFPSLGKVHKKKVENVKTEDDDDEDDTTSSYSAWNTARRKQSPRLPSEASFSFSQQSRGEYIFCVYISKRKKVKVISRYGDCVCACFVGRGLVINPAASSGASSRGRNLGRGKYLH